MPSRGTRAYGATSFSWRVVPEARLWRDASRTCDLFMVGSPQGVVSGAICDRLLSQPQRVRGGNRRGRLGIVVPQARLRRDVGREC